MSKPESPSDAAKRAADAVPGEVERKAVRERLRARRGVTALKREVALLETELEAERAAREMLLALKEQPPRVHKVKKRRHVTGKRRSTRLVTFSLLSDLHVDEDVDPNTVNGLNEYSVEIADQRLNYYWQRVISLVQKEQAAADIRTHVLWIGGDLFSGHIHEDLVESTSMAPLESVLWIKPRLESGIRMLTEELDIDELVVIWQYGNHGRDGKKPRVSTAAQHNYEWLLGQVLARDMESHAWAGKVRFIAERGYHTYLDVGGYAVRFHHGEGIGYAGGVGGITIPLNKAIAKWNQGLHADLDVLGHWHQMIDLQNAVMNGSLIGYNAYALRIKATYQPPAQAFFTVDLDRKVKSGFFTIHATPKNP